MKIRIWWGVAAWMALSAFAACGGSSGGGGDDEDCMPDIEGVDCVCGDEMYAPDCIGGEIVCGECNEPIGDCGPAVGDCAEGWYCALSNCAAEAGWCTPISDVCEQSFGGLTCGCDGEIYLTPCDVVTAGVDVSYGTNCAIDHDQFYCGAEICTVGEQWCKHKVDLGGEYCVTEPGCDCACLAKYPHCTTCTVGPNGGITLDCN